MSLRSFLFFLPSFLPSKYNRWEKDAHRQPKPQLDGTEVNVTREGKVNLFWKADAQDLLALFSPSLPSSRSSYRPTYPKSRLHKTYRTIQPASLSEPDSQAEAHTSGNLSSRLHNTCLPFLSSGLTFQSEAHPTIKPLFLPKKRSNLRNHGRQIQRPGLGVHLQGRRLDTKTGRGG